MSDNEVVDVYTVQADGSLEYYGTMNPNDIDLDKDEYITKNAE